MIQPTLAEVVVRVDRLEESDRTCEARIDESERVSEAKHRATKAEMRSSFEQLAEQSRGNGAAIGRVVKVVEQVLTEVSLLRKDVLKWQGDGAQLQGVVMGLKAQVDGAATKTDVEKARESIHDEVEEVKTGQHRTFAAIAHETAATREDLKMTKAELNKLRLLIVVRWGVVIATSIGTWELLKYLGYVAKVLHQ